MPPGHPRILVVRRDNIGDLICTTPLLRALRQHFPQAWLAVLVSSYNQDVLAGNPDVDEIFVFPKRQQRGFLTSLWQRLGLLLTLRRRHFDDILLANGGWRYARQLGGRRMIGFRERDNGPGQQPDVVIPLPDSHLVHEVRKMEKLGLALGLPRADGPLHLFPQAEVLATLQTRLMQAGYDPARPAIGIHISSRRPVQRWPEENFAELIRRLHGAGVGQFLLYWSPGAENDPLHPGDDEKAARLQAACAGLPLIPCPTYQVKELIAAMSLAERVVCSDGGAMHVAAGLGKPVLCFFGDSHIEQWHPWGVPHEVLHHDSNRVDAISVDAAIEGWQRLSATTGTAL